jgi:hypothetical protein
VSNGSGQDAFDSLVEGDFVKISQYDEPGVTHHGVIVDAKWVQSRLYDADNPGKGDLLFWHDGKPKPIPNDAPVNELHIVFQTDEREDDEDDGRREVWINKRLLKAAFQQAWKESGASKPELGAWWRVTRIEDGTPLRGKNKPRGWHVLYKTPDQYAETGPADAPKVSGARATVSADDNPFAG